MFGIYGYEHFLKEEEKTQIVSEVKKPKANTNELFLFTSTIGHLCPAGDRNYSKEVYDLTFF